MTTALAFNDVTFSPVTHENSLWIRATELARALGYGSEKNVSIIYARHRDEFTPAMTEVINLITPEAQNGLLGKMRIFSLRGCHLVAMFARTPVAKAFRRWVLDVLDQLNAENAAPCSNAAPADSGAAPLLSTSKTRKPLRLLVHSWSQITGVYHAALWPQIKAHFSLSRIDDLPEAWIPDALAFVQGKIDEAIRIKKGAFSQGAALPPPMPQEVLAQGTLTPCTELMPISRKEYPAASVVDEALRNALKHLTNAFQHCQFTDEASAPKESESRSLYIAAMCNIDAAGAILRAMIAAEKSRQA